MGPQTDLNLFKEKAAAVQVVISEITDVPAAFDYAADLTIKQGGKSMAAFGWEGQDHARPGGSLPPGRGESGRG